MAAELERWFEALPYHWQERAQCIRDLLLGAAPGVEEEWMFKSAPFYLHNGWLCFLAFKGDQLILGFCAGARMLDPQRLFAPTDHKVIRHYLPPAPTKRMNEAALRLLIDEAIATNAAIKEERALKAKRRKK